MNKLFLLFLLLIACSAKPVEQIADAKDEPKRIVIVESLQSYFSDRIKSDQPGLAVLVMRHDTVLFKNGFGLADLKSKQAVTPKTIFNLGSISKTFVANGILILQQRGLLSLDDNLAKFFPGFKNKSIANQVTIKHLLTHTSGLPDIRYPYRDSVFFLTARDNENWAPILKVQHLNFEPGSKFEYSNPAFNGLALVIESVTKKKWQNFIAQEIFEPAGMTNSTITDGPHPETGVAHGYIQSKGGWLEKDYMEEPTFAASGNGGVWSSVEELALYYKALQTATFLPKDVIAESFQVKKFSNWVDKTPEQIGWSWFSGKTKQGFTMIGHTGSQGGFRANFQFVPEREWLVIILSSAPRPLDEYTNRLFDFLQTGK